MKKIILLTIMVISILILSTPVYASDSYYKESIEILELGSKIGNDKLISLFENVEVSINTNKPTSEEEVKRIIMKEANKLEIELSHTDINKMDLFKPTISKEEVKKGLNEASEVFEDTERKLSNIETPKEQEPAVTDFISSLQNMFGLLSKFIHFILEIFEK